jgi:S-formylglutathione hydrolase FrmB
MAFLECNFFSDTLGLSTSMSVILPQEACRQIGQKNRTRAGRPPVLYLLHGLSDDHTIWMRRTSVERYAAPLGLAVVMPAVHRSFYADTRYGHRYWTFVSEELPGICGAFFNISNNREDTFVAGLSMGGYGAFKLALQRPDTFAAAASLSGVMDVRRFAKTGADDNLRRELTAIFGSVNGLSGGGNDLFMLAQQRAKKKARLPRLYMHCGTEDVLHQDNVRFHKHLDKLGVNHCYEEGRGDHEWGLWDRQIRRVLQWMMQ